MAHTLTVDKAGRVILPKPLRDKLHLRTGSRLRAEVVGGRIELTEDVPEAQVERRGRRRVVIGWEGFDAAKAVGEMREEQVARLSKPRRL